MAATDNRAVDDLHLASRSDARKRHRWLTVPSGFTLAVCLILPLFPFCHGSLPPLIAPQICWPYCIAFLIGIAALTAPYSIRVLAILIRVTIASYAIGWSAVFVESSKAIGTLVIVGGATVAAISWWPGSHERVIARSGCAVGMTATIWFASLIEYDNVLIGAYVALVGSVAMTLGCAWWWWEAYADSR